MAGKSRESLLKKSADKAAIPYSLLESHLGVRAALDAIGKAFLAIEFEERLRKDDPERICEGNCEVALRAVLKANAAATSFGCKLFTDLTFIEFAGASWDKRSEAQWFDGDVQLDARRWYSSCHEFTLDLAKSVLRMCDFREISSRDEIQNNDFTKISTIFRRSVGKLNSAALKSDLVKELGRAVINRRAWSVSLPIDALKSDQSAVDKLRSNPGPAPTYDEKEDDKLLADWAAAKAKGSSQPEFEDNRDLEEGSVEGARKRKAARKQRQKGKGQNSEAHY